MTLGELIEMLEGHDSAIVVRRGLENPHSYRGYYEQLAFELSGPMAIGKILEMAKSQIDETHHGWKGGLFTMHEHTTINLAEPGCCGEEIGTVLMEFLLNDQHEVEP